MSTPAGVMVIYPGHHDGIRRGCVFVRVGWRLKLQRFRYTRLTAPVPVDDAEDLTEGDTNDDEPVVRPEAGHCPTCGQRVGLFTAGDGTSYYLATAEQEASELEFVKMEAKAAQMVDSATIAELVDERRQVELYAEQMVRSADGHVQRSGADLLGILRAE